MANNNAGPMRLDPNAVFEPCMISDEMDIENGRTIVWRNYVVMSSGPFSYSHLSPPDPGVPCGLTSVNVSCSDGVAEITWTFRAEFADPQQTQQNERPQYELQGSTSQEPIAAHPKYPDLYNKYARSQKDGEPVWREKDPDNNSGTTGLSDGGQIISNISPMYGVRDYLQAQGVYRLTKYYTSRGAIPADLVSKVGKIDVPEKLSSPGVTGKWLRCGASIRQMGDAFQVTISWMASKDGALWKQEIYG